MQQLPKSPGGRVRAAGTSSQATPALTSIAPAESSREALAAVRQSSIPEYVAIGSAVISVVFALVTVLVWRKTRRDVRAVRHYAEKVRAIAANLEEIPSLRVRLGRLERSAEAAPSTLSQRTTASSTMPQERAVSATTEPLATAPPPQTPHEIPTRVAEQEPVVALEEPVKVEQPSRALPVELQGGQVVLSRSLVSLASLVLDGAEEHAQLFINDAVEIDHIAIERWSPFFDFGSGRPYHRFHTVQPALVKWDPASERGGIIRKGILEERS